MKEMKGMIIKKLRSIPKLGEPKQLLRVLRVNASDESPSPPLPHWSPQLLPGTPPHPSSGPGRALREIPVARDLQEPQKQQHGGCTPSPTHKAAGLCKASPPEPDIIDVAELMRDLEEEEDDDDLDEISDKENIGPASIAPIRTRKPPPPDKQQRPFSSSSPHSGSRGPPRPCCAPPASEHLDRSPFRRPDPNSDSLFDPDLLAAFEQAVVDHIRSYEELRSSKAHRTAFEEEEEKGKQQKGEDGAIDIDQEQPPYKIHRTRALADTNEEEQVAEADPSTGFELRCPPGGEDAVVFYTTSLRGIRKTFEDCSSVRLLLGSLRVRFCERDVSMHLGYREELWRVLGCRAIPPRLFVRGRYVGGADEVVGLHERGRLLPLLRGMPAYGPRSAPCRGCGGVGFVVCAKCSGSRKVVVGEGSRGESTRCPVCNENGLVVCGLCSWSCPPQSSLLQWPCWGGSVSQISSPFTHH